MKLIPTIAKKKTHFNIYKDFPIKRILSNPFIYYVNLYPYILYTLSLIVSNTYTFFVSFILHC